MGRFLDSDDRGEEPEVVGPHFQALGHTGSSHYFGLEHFPNPGVAKVVMISDEFTSICPITGQPDLYNVTIDYNPEERCLESKSLKLYLNTYRNSGGFCEALAVKIRDDVAECLEVSVEVVTVTLKQKSRGGISIIAVA